MKVAFLIEFFFTLLLPFIFLLDSWGIFLTFEMASSSLYPLKVVYVMNFWHFCTFWGAKRVMRAQKFFLQIFIRDTLFCCCSLRKKIFLGKLDLCINFWPQRGLGQLKRPYFHLAVFKLLLFFYTTLEHYNMYLLS